MKREWVVVVCCFLCLIFMCQMSSCSDIHRYSWDLTDLQIEETSEAWEIINFEDALTLESELSSSDQIIAESTLSDLEEEVLEATGKPVQYFHFTGIFSFEGEPDVQGTLTALVIVVEDSVPYIYDVRGPLTTVSCKHGDITWNQVNSYYEVEGDHRSVRLGASGFISIPTGDKIITEEVSNTVYPAFLVSLPST